MIPVTATLNAFLASLSSSVIHTHAHLLTRERATADLHTPISYSLFIYLAKFYFVFFQWHTIDSNMSVCAQSAPQL